MQPLSREIWMPPCGGGQVLVKWCEKDLCPAGRGKGKTMIKVILWDIDGTLLDFKAAEREAIIQCFAKFHMGSCTQEQLARYSALNHSYWQRLERGEITKERLLVERFEEFFSQEGYDPALAARFNHQYQLELGETICFRDRGYELVDSLRGQVKQYAVTNGTKIAQDRKLEKSGLIRLFDGVFISEVVGAEKPNPLFFERVFNSIGRYDRGEVLIVGDSLTSDMKGGLNAGILTCWYNPKGEEVPEGMALDYVISDLNQVKDILT